jgi:hypothetical protein
MMSEPVMIAAHRLADVLERENAALGTMDLRRVASLLPEKTAAIAGLTGFGQSASDPDLVSISHRLHNLVLENRGLLKRAITAQQRVIGIVVRAAAAAATPPCYGPGRARLIGPMAVSTRS